VPVLFDLLFSLLQGDRNSLLNKSFEAVVPLDGITEATPKGIRDRIALWMVEVKAQAPGDVWRCSRENPLFQSLCASKIYGGLMLVR
jgi:hypothetical protein